MSPNRERGERPDEEPEPRVVIRDKRRIDPVTGEVRHPEGAAPAAPSGSAAPSGDAATWKTGEAPAPGESAEVTELRTKVTELTADVQRVSAEYANYRKRVDRDRAAVVESATGSVLAALLPVLDDLDRAREHGDLTGAFKAVADQFAAVLEKLGLAAFGEPGDPFDPTVHEAVMHSTGPDVTEPTAVQILRRGYRQGERLLRPAMVAVRDPESPAPGDRSAEATSTESTSIEDSSAGGPSAGDDSADAEWVAPEDLPNEK